MKKFDIHTTLSPRYYTLLTKYQEKYGTKQKALEEALEALDNRVSDKQNMPLSPEEELWMRVGRELKNVLIIYQKDIPNC
jgi:hypothetical protein